MKNRNTDGSIACAIERLERRQLFAAALAGAGAVSMAFDAQGILYAAYYDSAQHDLLYASRNASGVWSPATTIDAGPNVGSQLSLALDRSGRPGVAYYDAANGDLKYAHLAGGTWSLAVVDAGGDVGRNPFLAFDAADHPLISYYDAMHRSLRLAAWAKNRLRITTIASGASAGPFSRVAVNPFDGTLAVAFESSAKRQIRVLRGKPGHLKSSTIATLASNGAVTPSVAFDASGGAAVSFVDPSSGSLMLAEPARHGWNTSSILSGADFHQAVELSFVASTHKPQVLFAGSDGNVCLASLAGNTWTSIPVGAEVLSNVAIDPASGAIVFAESGNVTQIDPILAAPAGVTATAVSSREIDLSWSESSTQATGFVVQRATAGGAFASIATLGNSLTYADTAVTQGVSYAYRLCAVDAAGSSLNSAVVNAAAPSNAPTNFVAQISLDWAPWIELSWTDNATAESGYRIERATDGTHFSTIDILPPASTDYLDTLDLEEQTYTYRVIPFDASGEGASSSEQAVTTGVAAPASLQAIVVNSGRVDLSWTNVSLSADHLEIDCIANGVNATVDTNVSVARNSYSVTSLADGSALLPNTSYTFYVMAVRSDQSAASNPAPCLTGFDSPPQLEVDSLGSDQVTLTWGDVLGETGYEIQSSPDNTHFTTAATTGPDVTRYTISGLPENTTYHFRIRALSDSGDSTFLWYAMPTTELTAPTNIFATPLTGGSVQLDWTGNSSAATSYQITVAQGNGQFANAITLPAGTTSAVITTGPTGPLQPGVTYRLQIVAMTADNQSSPVEVDNITAIP